MNYPLLKGRVVHGAGRGRGLGAPTLNMDVQPRDLPEGVYAAYATIEQKKYSCVFHWGSRPTFNESHPILEVHLLEVDMDLYGQDVELQAIAWLREVRSFSSPEALKAQIQEDITRAKQVL